jgi:hypothetical protein
MKLVVTESIIMVMAKLFITNVNCYKRQNSLKLIQEDFFMKKRSRNCGLMSARHKISALIP